MRKILIHWLVLCPKGILLFAFSFAKLNLFPKGRSSLWSYRFSVTFLLKLKKDLDSRKIWHSLLIGEQKKGGKETDFQSRLAVLEVFSLFHSLPHYRRHSIFHCLPDHLQELQTVLWSSFPYFLQTIILWSKLDWQRVTVSKLLSDLLLYAYSFVYTQPAQVHGSHGPPLIRGFQIGATINQSK